MPFLNVQAPVQAPLMTLALDYNSTVSVVSTTLGRCAVEARIEQQKKETTSTLALLRCLHTGEEAFMPQDGLNTNTVTNAPTNKRTSTKEAIARLESLQDKVWAIMGLKMAVDKLRDLKYDVVLAQEDGACTIKITLGVNFDMTTGLIDGKDIWAVETALEKQIEELKGKPSRLEE